MVLLEVFHRIIKASGHGRNPGSLSGFQIIEILVHRLARVELILNAVQPGHQHRGKGQVRIAGRSEEHTSELQSRSDLVCRLLLEKKKKKKTQKYNYNT